MLHGEDVRAAQYLLKHNRWGRNFQPGEADGYFGPQSAHAARRAKYYLGYSMSHVLPFFGPDLFDLLVPVDNKWHATLGPMQKIRHQRRIAEASKSWRSLAIKEAKTHIGYKESPPGSNHTEFNRWYYGADIAAPWCAIFVSYCRNKAGDHNWKYSFVPEVLMLARGHLNRMSVVTSPGHGDLVAYDWNNDGIADHLEFFDTWIDRAKGTFRAVGGNTGAFDRSNGGEVLESERFVSDVEAFIHVSRV